MYILSSYSFLDPRHDEGVSNVTQVTEDILNYFSPFIFLPSRIG
jgi:hypothetical protein